MDEVLRELLKEMLKNQKEILWNQLAFLEGRITDPMLASDTREFFKRRRDATRTLLEG